MNVRWTLTIKRPLSKATFSLWRDLYPWGIYFVSAKDGMKTIINKSKKSFLESIKNIYRSKNAWILCKITSEMQLDDLFIYLLIYIFIYLFIYLFFHLIFVVYSFFDANRYKYSSVLDNTIFIQPEKGQFCKYTNKIIQYWNLRQ